MKTITHESTLRKILLIQGLLTMWKTCPNFPEKNSYGFIEFSFTKLFNIQ